MQQPHPGRQQTEELCIEHAARLFRQRQQADENIRLLQKARELVRAMKTGNALYPLFAAAPPGKRKLERLQALNSRAGQHAKAEEANPAFGRLSSGNRLPEAPFLLLEIGGHIPVESQHAERDV